MHHVRPRCERLIPALLTAVVLLGGCSGGPDEATDDSGASDRDSTTSTALDVAVTTTRTETERYEATGNETISFEPTCDPGPPFGPGPVTCERVGTDTYITVANPITKTGTFDGTMLLEATIILSDSGDYRMSGDAVFEGTVAGCGTGTVKLLIENEGNIAEGLTLNRQHTPSDGDTGTLDVRSELDYVANGPVSTLSSGTYSCPQYDATQASNTGENPPADSADVAEGTVREGSGTVSFVFSPTCDPGPPLTAGPMTCEQSGTDVIIGLRNPGQRTGAMEGTQVFDGTMTLSADGSFVTSGTVRFEGSIEGCGIGTLTTFVETEGSLLDGQTVFRETWVPNETDTLRATLLSGGAVETSGSTSNYTITYTC